jgi:DNA adenine methylase
VAVKPSKAAIHFPSPPEHGPARPFLKWAGGKQQLLAQYEPHFPKKIERYLEPFVGGGAVFFHLWNQRRLPDEAFLLDHNAELVNVYRAVRDCVDDLIDQLTIHQSNHSKDYFYRLRGRDRGPDWPPDAISAAARTIYLNRTCYNGLYRVNSRGEFNAPLGSYKNPDVVRAEVLRAASAALRGVAIEQTGFQSIMARARSGDFIYFDPPYDPLSPTANFTGYTAGAFGDDDQRQLAQVFAALTEKGCLCMLSNSHTDFIFSLYRDFRIEVVQAGRAINSKASQRGPINEVLVLNY